MQKQEQAERLKLIHHQLGEEYNTAFRALPQEVKKDHWQKCRAGTPAVWEELGLTYKTSEVGLCAALNLAIMNVANALYELDEEEPDLKLVRTTKRNVSLKRHRETP